MEEQSCFRPYPMSRRSRELCPRSNHPGCNHFNLRFSISNPHRPLRQLNPLTRPHPNSSLQNIETVRPQPDMPQLPEVQSSTFYPRKQKISRMTDQPAQLSQSAEMDYIGSSFPLRKKKTGEQQFLKLLLKFASDGQTRREYSPLFQDKCQPKTDRPKIKMRTTFHWTKRRYCVNRDKEKGMFLDGTRASQLGSYPRAP